MILVVKEKYNNNNNNNNKKKGPGITSWCTYVGSNVVFIFFHFLSLGWFLCVWKNFKYVAFKHLFNILKNDSYRVTRRKDLLSYTISVDYFCWDICKQNSNLQLPCTWIKSMHLSLLVKLHGTHQFSSFSLYICWAEVYYILLATCS